MIECDTVRSCSLLSLSIFRLLRFGGGRIHSSPFGGRLFGSIAGFLFDEFRGRRLLFELRRQCRLGGFSRSDPRPGAWHNHPGGGRVERLARPCHHHREGWHHQRGGHGAPHLLRARRSAERRVGEEGRFATFEVIGGEGGGGEIFYK